MIFSSKFLSKTMCSTLIKKLARRSFITYFSKESNLDKQNSNIVKLNTGSTGFTQWDEGSTIMRMPCLGACKAHPSNYWSLWLRSSFSVQKSAHNRYSVLYLNWLNTFLRVKQFGRLFEILKYNSVNEIL